MPWVETSSPHFGARHELEDGDDATAVLELLEGTRERLASVFELLPDGVAAVLHSSPVQLGIAQPYMPLVWLLTEPAGRRYITGWRSRSELHLLAPRLLERRASAVRGSREMVMLSPAALYVQAVVAANNDVLPRLARPARYARWAWLTAGAAQYFSGQTVYARAAIARRLHDGRRPSFPPGIRDAPLLGGSIFDLLEHERGIEATVALACSPARGAPRHALREAFPGRSLEESEAAWRAHLARLAEH
jgi:hypothetical protein